MKLSRLFLSLALVACLASVAYVAQLAEPSGVKMVSAAEKFLDGLTADQKTKTLIAFDDKERTNWHFTPQQDQNKKAKRKGLPLEEMNETQRQAALELLRAGTSADGTKKATTIMSLEAILRELEKGGRMVRNPDWYFFAIFGQPSKTGKWGWRVEGHHLALNFVVEAGRITAATPAFFGANPALVQQGPRKGLRTLPEAEDLARKLFEALTEEQKQVAHQAKEFPEIREEKIDSGVGEPMGLPAARMTDPQRAVLMRLIQSYANRMPADVAAVEMGRVKDAGPDKIHFAFSGKLELGQKHTYRVQGPTFVIEFLNVQDDSAKNPANHIHSVWRNLKGDFGLMARKD